MDKLNKILIINTIKKDLLSKEMKEANNCKSKMLTVPEWVHVFPLDKQEPIQISNNPLSVENLKLKLTSTDNRLSIIKMNNMAKADLFLASRTQLKSLRENPVSKTKKSVSKWILQRPIKQHNKWSSNLKSCNSNPRTKITNLSQRTWSKPKICQTVYCDEQLETTKEHKEASAAWVIIMAEVQTTETSQTNTNSFKRQREFNPLNNQPITSIKIPKLLLIHQTWHHVMEIIL